MNIRDRFIKFKNEVGVSIARVSREVNLAASTLYAWSGKAELPLSDKSLEKIDLYLKKFGY